MTTADGVSPSVTAGQVLFSLIAFVAIYAILAVVMAYLFIRVIQKGPYAAETQAETSSDPFDKEEYRHAIS
ncbi:Bacterial Cytochrome Ubiquinol Oxidase [Paenibacillus sp. P1XP2]|nr:Bacterial Cytochrome Ubiquinol Oxidase [Paenibacillus sp. P1XP2]